MPFTRKDAVKKPGVAGLQEDPDDTGMEVVEVSGALFTWEVKNKQKK